MDPELRKKIILRDLVLEFFNADHGRSVHEMKSDERLATYKDEDLGNMRLALSECGLIALINGYGNGSSYQTTDDGLIFLEAIKNYEL